MKDLNVLVISSNENFGTLVSETLEDAGFDSARIHSASCYSDAEEKLGLLGKRAIVLTEPFTFDASRGKVCVSPLVEKALSSGHTPVLLRGASLETLSVPLKMMAGAGLPSIIQSSQLMDSEVLYTELDRCYNMLD